jgi:4-hydroxybenzoate polyprenyltransferase
MTAAARLPDAPSRNWVDRFAPRWAQPWLKLGRFDRPAGTWLLLLPGWQGIALAAAVQGRWPDPWLIGLFAIGAAVMRAAGCGYNDVVDRDIDARVARTARRPIPSGQISVRQAWGFITGCCLVGLLILLAMNPYAIALGVLSLGLVAAYPFMKRITWWPQAWLGLTFNWGALLGFAAAQGGAPGYVHLLAAAVGLAQPGSLNMVAAPLHPVWGPDLLLYASGLFWTLGYDTIYALQDLEDDALVGVKSSARRLGAAAPAGVLVFYAASAGLAAAAGATARLGPGFWVLLVAYAAHLLWQAARVRVDDPGRALHLFRSNRDAGLVLFAALALGGSAA